MFIELTVKIVTWFVPTNCTIKLLKMPPAKVLPKACSLDASWMQLRE